MIWEYIIRYMQPNITEIQKFPKADKVLRDGFTKLNENIQEKDNA